MLQGSSHAPIGKIFCRASKLIPSWVMFDLLNISDGFSVLSVRFEVGVCLLLAPARADKRGLGAPFPLVGYAGLQEITRCSSGGSRVSLKALGFGKKLAFLLGR